MTERNKHPGISNEITNPPLGVGSGVCCTTKKC